MKSVVAKNKGRASPSSPESVEAELYEQFQLMFPISTQRRRDAEERREMRMDFRVVAGGVPGMLCVSPRLRVSALKPSRDFQRRGAEAQRRRDAEERREVERNC